MDALLSKLPDFGVLAIVCGLLIYNVMYLQKKLISVIENNTAAMTKLKDYCSNKKESLDNP